MAKKLTLEEIGKLAGVSRSTVSRVVNGQPDVKADVRERVMKVVRETGFVPNPAARSLAAQRSGILGLVIPRSVATFFGDPYFSRLTQGISQACYEQGYMLSLFLFYTEKEEELLLPRIAQRSFLDGVIVQATTDADPIIPQLQKSTMPFLVVGRLNEMPDNLSFIDVDNVSGAKNAVEHLIKLGHERIAHVSGRVDNRPAADRKIGYEKALSENGIPIDSNLIVNGEFSEEGGYAAAQALLPYKPDAIFAASDTMAVGVVRALKDAGLLVPNDIAVMGFDDLIPAQRSEPQLSTVKQPILRFGVSAVEVLINIIEKGDMPPRQALYDTELIIRNSCGAKL
ncbi:MAG: LacI family transcriptional regulator [Chloroflexi bacterium]|nr:LacI family transcriptional regulator [Chloroflexota bacterium]